MHVLLENAACENFVPTCVENELPPNLIHCLRLLRVLELQHSAEAATEALEKAISASDALLVLLTKRLRMLKQCKDATDTLKALATEPEPLGKDATKNVSQLLVLLCTHPSVGEQLRPHLFGLFASASASYPAPQGGVHVARAASIVICALAEHCLTRQVVLYIHKRKMVVYMVHDIKELVDMVSGESTAAVVSSSMVPNGLQVARQHAAEQAGLWALALHAVVHLVAFSCRHDGVELVRDFEAADGYRVLQYAIDNSTFIKHREKLVDLLPVLASCPSAAAEDSDERH